MTIGQWIKKHRISSGWSQEDVARHFQVNRSAVAQWESGVTKPHHLRIPDLQSRFGVIPDKIARATWG